MLTKITRTINRFATAAADKSAGLHIRAIERTIDAENARVQRAFGRAHAMADLADALYDDAKAASLRRQTVTAQAEAEIAAVSAGLRGEA